MLRSYSRRAAIGSALAAGAAGAVAATPAAATASEARSGGGKVDGENGRIYYLRRGRQAATVTGVAASLMSWTVDGEELLFTNDPRIQGEDGWQGKTLLPWCNRVKAGKYTFGGVEYQLPVNEVERNAALHGLMGFVEWDPVYTMRDRLALSYVEPPSYGYPFHMRYQIEYSLDEHGVSVTLTAHNIGTMRAPITTATHTYVAAPPGKHIDDITMTLPARTYYVVDDNLIPTGTAPVAGTEYDFRTPRRIGATEMDTAFTHVRKPNGRSRAVLRRPGSVDVEMWMDEAHDFYQIYTDDGPSVPREHRLGLAIEPMVGAPDAFNNGDGLVTLGPGKRWRGSWGLRALS